MNYLAVLAATVVIIALGFLWYSPVLFGNAWKKQVGLRKEDMSSGSPLTFILAPLTALGGAFLLALLQTMKEEPSLLSGIVIGLLIGISVSLNIGMNFLFESRTLRLYLIIIGYHLVSYLLAGLIIGAM